MDNTACPIYLNNETVKQLLDWDQIVPLIEQCMINISDSSKVIQPVRTIMRIPSKDGLLLTMPAFSQSNDALGCKLVTSFPKNKEKHLPSVLATIVLNDCNSGKVFAIMDGTEITAWRTAAASIVGTKYLHIGPKSILSILGAGTQARSHAMGMKRIFNFNEIRIWNHRRGRAEQLANELLQNGISVKIFPTVESCVQNADVIVTATYATEPILKYGWVKYDAIINAVGAGYSHHSEIDEELYKSSVVYVDNNEAAKSELKGLKDFGVDIQGELGDVILGKVNVKQGVINIFHALGKLFHRIKIH